MPQARVGTSGFRGRFQPSKSGAEELSAWGTLAFTVNVDTVTGPLRLAWWGELHNAPGLMAELGLNPAVPLSELMGRAWQQWSTDTCHRLDGVFAMAASSANELVLYRDSSGLRNLFLSRDAEGTVVYATDLESVPAAPVMQDTPRRVARRGLHEYLRLGDVAAPATLFSRIDAIEPGQTRLCAAATQAPVPSRANLAAPASPERFEDAVDHLDALLRQAVQSRLADTAQPAAFLSGGIDSSLLCAMAARARPDLTAITVGFDTAPFDETPIAERVARHLGLSHETWRFDRDDCLAGFERLSRAAEQPVADPAAMVTVLAFERCRDRFDAVLDGSGADESVGMLPPRHVRLAVAHAALLPGRIRRGVASLLRLSPRLQGYLPIVDFDHPAELMMRWAAFTHDEIAALCGEAVSLDHTLFYRTFERFARTAHFERYSALVETMPSERLTQAMRISGATVRFPFWSIDVDRFVRRLPTEYRYLPGEPKRILRGALARHVPRPLWDVPKHGFDFPVAEFLQGDNFSLVRQYLDAGICRRASWLVPEEVAMWARRFIAGEPGLTFRVWRLVVLGAWLQHHPEAWETT